ncbi:MAG TPA: phospholipase D-like domain-containing protein [Acetobacteraceae bacterium]|nr:phospholipase D-like domain-containing protein [Acetobacteraceae bacterium]
MKLLEALAGEAFARVAEAQHSIGNDVRLLRDAAQTYPAWLDAIANAEHYVHLENYIIQEDRVGRAFADALIQAARRGVACRVIYDWLGCLRRTSGPFWVRLIAAGVEVRRYNPPSFDNSLRWISRDHRKVLCVDGVVAFTGGLCIGHDWLGDPVRNIAPWRDTAVEIRGPAVAQVNAAFADSWAVCGSPLAADMQVPPPPAVAGGGVDISVIAGRPNSMGLYRLEQLIAEIAERSLWLTDGYFVATTGYVRALSGAANAGVDVRLLIPGSSDWPIIGAMSKSAYHPLLEFGVRVFEWNGSMLHAKTAVADGCWSRIGSSNSNIASWITNRELDVTIKDEHLAGQMEAMFEEDMANATEIVLQRGRSGINRPSSGSGAKFTRPPSMAASRLFSGAIGFGSTLSASLTQHRIVGSQEAMVLLGGGALLLLIALVAIAWPMVLTLPLAALALWVAADLLIRAFRLWRIGRRRG